LLWVCLYGTLGSQCRNCIVYQGLTYFNDKDVVKKNNRLWMGARNVAFEKVRKKIVGLSDQAVGDNPNYLLSLSRGRKRLIMMVYDFVVLALALWGGFVLRIAELWPTEYLHESSWLFVLVPAAGVLLFKVMGLYKLFIRYMGMESIWLVVKSVAVLAVIILSVDQFLEYPLLPRSVPIGFALFSLLLVGGGRFVFKQYVLWMEKHYVEKSVVLIYGAGAAGSRLALSLASDGEYFPCGFIDDDPSLWGGDIRGLQVFKPDEIATLIELHSVSHVLLAMPSVEITRKKKVLDMLEQYPVHVQTLPTMSEIVSGKKSLDQIREVELEELLGREPVDTSNETLDISIHQKVVMVTGAGGSIGSELCRQVILSNPSALVLFELSEFSLYQVDQSLRNLMTEKGVSCPIYPLLGSVCDANRVTEIINRFGVQTIYHAAAYKHVPIVEHNVLQGIENNVFGTQTVASIAERLSVERFVLVSTDKAVRPTNVMGATKRLAELILQDRAALKSGTQFSMVRFGNVLGSSGSVVPLFRRQIEAGGPVTVTDKNITRFFMTIPEAASLVIQAGSMGEGGDVFVLDMGEPVKIVDLAKRMIHLTGFNTEEGGIEITYTGLRPGEKLYEELLIGDDVIETSHPKIMRAHEELLSTEQLDSLLVQLKTAVEHGDSAQGRILLQKNISGFNPTSGLVDLLNQEAVVH